MPEGAQFAWSAFSVLSDDRGWAVQGFGSMSAMFIEPIPKRIAYTAISAYARDFGIRGEHFERLLWFVREMDDEYLQIQAEQSRTRWERLRQQK